MQLKQGKRYKPIAYIETLREKPCGTRLFGGKMVTFDVFTNAFLCACVPLLRFVGGGLLRHIFPNSKFVCRPSKSAFHILCKRSAAATRIQLAAPALLEVQIHGSSCINRCWCSRYQTSDSHSPAAGSRIPCHSWHREK